MAFYSKSSHFSFDPAVLLVQELFLKKMIMSPLQGQWGWMIINIGASPYTNLYCPFRASTPAGFNTLAQGLVPVSTGMLFIVHHVNPIFGKHILIR